MIFSCWTKYKNRKHHIPYRISRVSRQNTESLFNCMLNVEYRFDLIFSNGYPFDIFLRSIILTNGVDALLKATTHSVRNTIKIKRFDNMSPCQTIYSWRLRHKIQIRSSDSDDSWEMQRILQYFCSHVMLLPSFAIRLMGLTKHNRIARSNQSIE